MTALATLPQSLNATESHSLIDRLLQIACSSRWIEDHFSFRVNSRGRFEYQLSQPIRAGQRIYPPGYPDTKMTRCPSCGRWGPPGGERCYECETDALTPEQLKSYPSAICYREYIPSMAEEMAEKFACSADADDINPHVRDRIRINRKIADKRFNRASQQRAPGCQIVTLKGGSGAEWAGAHFAVEQDPETQEPVWIDPEIFKKSMAEDVRALEKEIDYFLQTGRIEAIATYNQIERRNYKRPKLLAGNKYKTKHEIGPCGLWFTVESGEALSRKSRPCPTVEDEPLSLSDGKWVRGRDGLDRLQFSDTDKQELDADELIERFNAKRTRQGRDLLDPENPMEGMSSREYKLYAKAIGRDWDEVSEDDLLLPSQRLDR